MASNTATAVVLDITLHSLELVFFRADQALILNHDALPPDRPIAGSDVG
jgi:hypothetical protein